MVTTIEHVVEVAVPTPGARRSPGFEPPQETGHERRVRVGGVGGVGDALPGVVASLGLAALVLFGGAGVLAAAGTLVIAGVVAALGLEPTRRWLRSRGPSRRALDAQEVAVAAWRETKEPLLVVVKGSVVFANHAAAGLLHAHDASALVGKPVESLAARADAETLASAMNGAGPSPRFVSLWLVGLDGAPRAAQAGVVAAEWRGAPAAQLVLVDTSNLHHLVNEAQEVKREQEVLGVGSAAVAGATSAAALADAVCRGVVQHQGIALSWMGLVGPGEPPELHALASYGVDPAPLKRLLERDTRPAELTTALREGHPWMTDDLARDVVTEVAREDALRCGLASLLMLPLAANGRVLGVLALASREAAAFDGREVRRLEALAHLVGAALERHLHPEGRSRPT
jgi:hypothetical protein